MPYVSVKSKTIAGRSYERGEVVDTSALTMAKLASLVRVGLLIQSDQAVSAGVELATPAPALEPDATDEQPEGDFCPVCEKGPYKALHMHMRSHDEESN